MTTQTEIDLDLLLGPVDPWQLILWNDDFTPFDHVVSTLETVLEIPTGRAERFAMEAHTLGRAILTHGTKEDMTVKAEAILSAHITASVEKPA